MNGPLSESPPRPRQTGAGGQSETRAERSAAPSRCQGPSEERPASRFYGTSSLKRRRRTKGELDRLLTATKSILAAEESAITIRHLFYRLVGLHVIQKEECAYKHLCGCLGRWRRGGQIAFGAFVDGTRWYLQPRLFNDADEALADTAECYRKNLWCAQPHYLECWCEKDAISSILYGVTASFGVPLFVCRGFPSITSLSNAAEQFRAALRAGKQARVLYFGDWDPSGLAIDRGAERALCKDFNLVGVEFKRVAVTPEQIARLNLPTRPVKNSDSRARKWRGGDCVEVDTISAGELQDLVRAEITALIDPYQWSQMKRAEDLERESLENVLGAWRKGKP